MQLEGTRIVVTGGARGIGEAVVRAYVAEGALVASLDVLDDDGRDVADAATREGPGSARYHHCDISRRSEVERVFTVVADEWGGLDVLANIAGVERTGPAESITDDTWDLIFDVNVRGVFLTNQAACRVMKEGGGGRIINYGSDAALGPFPNGAAYSASKGAVHSWTRTVAHEWGRYGITANCVIPAMWTPMYDAHRARMSPEELAAHDAMMAGLIPLGGRLGRPARDLAPLMVFLAGPGAGFITGQIYSVNGGLGSVR